MKFCCRHFSIAILTVVLLTNSYLLLTIQQLEQTVKSYEMNGFDTDTVRAELELSLKEHKLTLTPQLGPNFTTNIFNALKRRVAVLTEWLIWLAAAAFLFIIPGWALLDLFLPGWDSLDIWERLALGSGVGLSLQFLLFLWTDLIGVYLGAAYAWLPGCLALLAILWNSRRRLNVLPRLRSMLSKEGRTRSLTWDGLLMSLVLGLVFSARLLAIRSVVAPMWGDSVQHTTIAQLIVDKGGLFQSWLPYAPYNTLTVHYGFSSAVALFSWIADMDSMQATLVAGQILNGLAILSLYPLAIRLSDRNRLSGIGAVIAAGIFSPMPAYYVNYGRYAQLTGQVILPVSIWLLWESIEPQKDTFRGTNRNILRHTSLAGIALAGMILGYYRTPFYYASFGLILLLCVGFPRWMKAEYSMLRGLGSLIMIVMFSLLLLLPWLPRLAGSNLVNAVSSGISNMAPLTKVILDLQGWRDISYYAPWGMLALVAAAVLWAIFKRRWLVAVLALWFPLMAVYLFGQILGLPGANMLQTFALLISVYMPVSLLIGWLIGEIAHRLEYTNRLSPALLGVFVLAAGLWGWNPQRKISQPDIFAMVEKPDLRAAKWIRAHTPTDAIFLIEGFSIYGGTSAVGSDAGWWLPITAGRQTNIPPQYAQFNERPDIPGYTKQVAALVVALEQQPVTSPDNLQRLCLFGISHVYIGQKQGRVGFNAPQLFSPDELSASSAFKLLYHRDKVYIFKLKACKLYFPLTDVAE